MQHPVWQRFITLNQPPFFRHQFTSYRRQNGPGQCTGVYLSPLGVQPKALIIFVHGAGNDFIYPQLNLFRRLLLGGLAIFSFNVDGHGRSDTTVFHPERLFDCVDDAYLHGREFAPELPVHLIGQSLGGALILGFLHNHPERRVTKAAIISTPLSLAHVERAFFNEGLSLLRFTVYRQLPLYGFYDLIPAFGVLKRQSFPVRFDPSLGRKASLSPFAIAKVAYNQMHLEAKLSDITIPTLLCYGSWDQIGPLEQGQIIHRTIPNSRLLVLPRETHFSTLFAKQTEVEILRWLS